MLALQLVDHWGNRHTPRPRPRADVLVAALLLPPARHGELATLSRLAEGCSRYAAYLLRRLAAAAGPRDAGHADWQALLVSCQHDPRYRDVVSSGADAVNLAILTIAHAVAAHLVARGGNAVFPDLPGKDGPTPLRVVRVGERSYRLRPWPLAGRRLTLHAEPPPGTGRAGAAPGEGSVPGAPPPRHLTWTLLAPGAPAD